MDLGLHRTEFPAAESEGMMFQSLLLLTLGGLLIYSAFQTPPDPRKVLGDVFGKPFSGGGGGSFSGHGASGSF